MDHANSNDRMIGDLVENPLIEWVDILMPDTVGVLRGKRVHKSQYPKIVKGQGLFPSSLYGIETNGENVDDCALVWSEGDADRPIYVEPDSLREIPWRPDSAQVLGGLMEADGSPLYADPRAIAKSLDDKLAAKALTAQIAIEYEFYLFDQAFGEGGLPLAPEAPGRLFKPNTSEVYLMDRFDEREEFINNVHEFASMQGMQVQSISAEFSPNQYEINLSHGPTLLAACDEAVMFKRLIKAAAEKAGYTASFMAKPMMGQSGNGLHVHISITDQKTGRNIFEQDDKKFKKALWGLCETMEQSVLLFAPNPNSYRRLQPGSYAPISVNWGINNRTVALRVPKSEPEATRIEHRCAGADANPYLVAAAVAAGILHGLEQKEASPGDAVKGNAYDQEHLFRQLPTTMPQAIDAFRQAEILPGYFDPRFCELYFLSRLAEMQRFNSYISSLEYEWYFKTV